MFNVHVSVGRRKRVHGMEPENTPPFATQNFSNLKICVNRDLPPANCWACVSRNQSLVERANVNTVCRQLHVCFESFVAYIP